MAARIAERRRIRLRCRARSMDRRGLRRGDLPVLRRERLPAIAADDPGGSSTRSCRPSTSPGSVFKMLTVTAGLGQRHRDDDDRSQRHRAPRARRGTRPRRRRGPPGDGRDEVPGRASPTRATSSPRRSRWASRRPPRRRRDPVRHLAPDGLRHADRHRRRRRDAGHRAATRRSRRGARSTSPTAPSGRASPSRRSSSPRPTRRWSTAGCSSSRTSSLDRRARDPPGAPEGRVMTTQLSKHAAGADAARAHARSTSTAAGRSSRASRSAARPAPRRSGTPTSSAGRSTCSTSRSSGSSAASRPPRSRRRGPDR